MKQWISKTTPDLGLLLIRIGLGIQMMLHGWPKITGGVEKWEKLGSKMSLIGIDFMPAFWGFMAAFSEFGGGLWLLLGFFNRPVSALLAFTMLIAAIYHWTDEGKFMAGSHAFELMIVFIGLYFIGSGRYSIDRKIFN